MEECFRQHNTIRCLAEHRLKLIQHVKVFHEDFLHEPFCGHYSHCSNHALFPGSNPLFHKSKGIRSRKVKRLDLAEGSTQSAAEVKAE